MRRVKKNRNPRAASWTLGLDLGTTAVKAVLLDPAGRTVALTREPAPLVERPEEGLAEIPLAPLQRAAGSALTRALRHAPAAVPLRLGIASQRSSAVVWDARTGRPLGPGLCWRDRRVALPWPPAGLTEREVARRTGLRLSPHYGAGKIARLLRAGTPPGADLRAAPLPSWLVWRWSRGRLLVSDPTLAARLLLWNLKDNAWDPRLTRAFGVRQSLLPRVLPSAAEYGTLGIGGRRLALGAMIGDQQAAALALGLGAGFGLINLGTGAFLLCPTGTRPVRARGLLSTALWSDADGVRYALEGTVNSLGALYGHFRKRGLGDPSRESLPSPAEAERLPACLPALAGTGAPRWDPSERLRFAGEGVRPSARARRRAALLAPAYRLREIWDALPASRRPDRLVVSGGLAACGPLVQALADLLQRPLIRGGSQEATALGAALLANGGLGGIPPPSGETVRPRASREKAYRRWARLLKTAASSLP